MRKNPRKTDLLNSLRNGIRESRLIEKGARCLLAVSGGMDSVTMLDLFFRLQPAFELKLAVIHVNHGIRGAEADADERFVGELAIRYGCPFFFTVVDAMTHAGAQKLSLEESARDLRYSFFQSVMAREDYGLLATAHTRNDQAETVIDHFLRGSGSTGLRGIPVKRGRFVRPMLRFGRTEIEAYAADRELPYRTDSTNKDLSFRRNRIRHELIPYIQKHFNQGIVETLNRTATVFLETDNYLNSIAQDALKSLVSLHKKNEIVLDIDGFLRYNRLVQKYVLVHCCRLLSLDSGNFRFAEFDEVLRLVAAKKPGKQRRLSTKVRVMVDHDGLVIGKAELKKLPRVQIDLARGNRLKYENFVFEWAICAIEQRSGFTEDVRSEVLDFAATGPVVELSGLRRGAYFYPLKMGGKKKVSDYLTDEKIPLRKRARLPLLDCPSGIAWVCGHRIDDRFKVTKKTATILKMKMTELEDE